MVIFYKLFDSGVSDSLGHPDHYSNGAYNSRKYQNRGWLYKMRNLTHSI